MPNQAQQLYILYAQHLYKLHWQITWLQYLTQLQEVKPPSQPLDNKWTITPIVVIQGMTKFAGAKFERRQTAQRVNGRGVVSKMVDQFGIINMRGRIYDFALGRVLQADPFVQDPTNTQSFNRYTYVFNNPLSYTDPSGYFSLRTALGFAVGLVLSIFNPFAIKDKGVRSLV